MVAKQVQKVVPSARVGTGGEKIEERRPFVDLRKISPLSIDLRTRWWDVSFFIFLIFHHKLSIMVIRWSNILLYNRALASCCRTTTNTSSAPLHHFNTIVLLSQTKIIIATTTNNFKFLIKSAEDHLGQRFDLKFNKRAYLSIDTMSIEHIYS